MFKILRKSVQTGLVTIGYPETPIPAPEQMRGAPRFHFAAWRNAHIAAEACPTGAIFISESNGTCQVVVDYGKCIYCGECGDADPDAVEMTNECELAVTDRRDLMATAEYGVNQEGIQYELKRVRYGEALAARVRDRVRQTLGRSLAIREVDGGSCNGCEVEITALNNPLYDLERLGIHFVASPRHADMLLVTGPVTRNMELALSKTYHATPDPKVVVAVGACGISGGIFGRNYATLGGVDQVVPVDVYIPGCPPHPIALLHGILLAVGRIGQKGIPR
jgi:Ni,Fe-hydrogenase III small subunit/formate hydrogenlyase subunit 6/NADH:ubiquinone oxidoreductase subunit I